MTLGLLDVRCGDDFSGEVQPLTEVLETLGGEGVVVVLPGELSLEVVAGGERLASFDDLLSPCQLTLFVYSAWREGEGVRT